MQMFSRTHSLAAALLAAVTFGLPASAQAKSYGTNSYVTCDNNTDQQVTAGLIGATIGGVVGSQVSGNGARTEGSTLGAVIGAVAGAAIAGQEDCRRTGITQHKTAKSIHPVHPVHPGHKNHSRRYDDKYQMVHDSRYYGSRYRTTHYHSSYRSSLEHQLEYVSAEIEQLKRKRDYLESRRRYRYDPYLERKIYDVNCEIDRLKDKRKRIKSKLRDSYYYRY